MSVIAQNSSAQTTATNNNKTRGLSLHTVSLSVSAVQ